MTTDREVMQMALDVMLAAIKAGDWKVDGACDPDYVFEALRARLAQGEQDTECPYCAGSGCVACDARCLPQGEQEPVAWMYDWYAEDEDLDGVPTGGIFNDWISKDYDEAHSPTMGCYNIRPLYTAPPQRPWQKLTEQESGAIMEELNAYGTRLYEFARAIEAKLKEKNGY